MSFASLAASPVFANGMANLAVAAPYIALLALLLSFVLLFMVLSLRSRLTRLTLGKSGSLEESIAVLGREMKEAQHFRSEMEKYLKLVEMRLRGNVSGLGIVRFNPFAGEGSGGNQSFAIALLDEGGSGVVLSSLYSRDRVGVYCKPIQNGTSQYELSQEEKDAVSRAQTAVEKRNPKEARK